VHYFFKSYSGTHALSSILLDTGEDYPDDAPTYQKAVHPTEMVICQILYIWKLFRIITHFSLTKHIAWNLHPKFTIVFMGKLLSTHIISMNASNIRATIVIIRED